MEPRGPGTRYVFTALHRDEADPEETKRQALSLLVWSLLVWSLLVWSLVFHEGGGVAVDPFVAHVIGMK